MFYTCNPEFRELVWKPPLEKDFPVDCGLPECGDFLTFIVPIPGTSTLAKSTSVITEGLNYFYCIIPNLSLTPQLIKQQPPLF